MVLPHASSTLHVYGEHLTSFIFSLMTDFICLKSVASFVYFILYLQGSVLAFPCGWRDRQSVYWDFFFSPVVRTCCLFWLDRIFFFFFFLLPFRKSFPTFPVLTDYQHPVRWEEKSVADIKSLFTWIELYRHNILHNTLLEKNKKYLLLSWQIIVFPRSQKKPQNKSSYMSPALPPPYSCSSLMCGSEELW